MKHQIKHRYTDAVLFECELPDDTQSGLATRHALEKAVNVGAYLDGANLNGANLSRANLDGANLNGANLVGANLSRANLDGANLSRANLDGANLDGANLVGAYLSRANLDGAYLSRANLDGANLDGANLVGAYLDGAYLDGKKLIGNRPILMIGPIGSRCSYFTSYITDAGVMLRAGCFFGTVQEFKAKLIQEHGENNHRKEYEAALLLIECHHQIWK